MKRFLLPLLSVAIACLLSSCFRDEITISLKKDGSGTLTEQKYMRADTLEMLEQMAQMSRGNVDLVAEMASETKAKERAAKYGEGVTVEKTEIIEQSGWKGARIVYHFDDINHLKYSPSDSLPKMPGAPKSLTKNYPPVAFKYAGGKLTMTLPEPPKKEDDVPAPDIPAFDNDQEQVMKQMMAEMKFAVNLVIEPGIEATNATYVSGNTITISEIEFEKIASQPGALKKLSTAGRNDPSAAIEIMKQFEGVKVETKHELTVDLK